MKTSAILAVGLVASAQAFTPAPQGRVSGTQLSESLFDKVFGLDLFTPVKDQNDYGARFKKNLKVGEIKEGKSYVPAGLTASQYNKVRADEVAKKKARYEANVKKAGVFEDFTEWYKSRGTDVSQKWAKSATRGHRMAKTKYDWTGLTDKPLWAKKAQK